jgi:DNA-binding NtrC family response regulator
MTTVRILIVEDERSAAEFLRILLADEGYDVRVSYNGVEALIALEAKPADLVVSDLRMPVMDGLELLTHLVQRWPNLPVIMLTANSDVGDIVEAVQLGAVNYLLKPAPPALVLSTVGRALAARAVPLRESGSASGIVGASPAIVEVRHRVALAGRSDVPVLITGATGTGKELVARSIHAGSAVAAGPFVAHNCALAPTELFESEFFGHRRGSFTGADRDHEGLLVRAHGGVLFLDELETLPMHHQAKLLRVLDDGEVTPVGAEKAIQVSVRFVAATNRDPLEMIEAGALRNDLYFRLAGFQIRLPPLAARCEDIPLLAMYFAGEGHAGFTPEALDQLRSSDWPGNVRQLENAVRSACAAAGSGIVGVRHLDAGLGEDHSGLAATPSQPRAGGPDPAGLTLRELEQRAIELALETSGGNRSQAARQLGIDRSTLRRKMKDFEISDD